MGDAVKVRGMFLRPRQVEAVMASVDGVDAYRFIVDRVDNRHVLRCDAVVSEGADPDDVARDVRTSVRNGLRFDVDVRPVEDVTPADSSIVDSRTWD